ncbi:MAG: site-specific DNA-methyltransferase [Oscillospiraceae bacterium]|nr:site-specific DNA-methyltransferase [Oscillospiraceae bacterium]
MDKMKMHTPNMADENYRKLAALFPNAVTESIDPETGEVVRTIDADVLRQEISGRVVEGREERYQFTWPDKKKAMLAANAPIAATLRPVRADSVGRDGTPGRWDSENLYIEGDNLDVLKLLQETYLGKVKMIYIDPPYNTGNDFVYEDDFAEDAESYLGRSGQFDEQGNRLEQNTESNGRFHTDWLNMIYARLKLAKNLLTDDGVIAISIDENEIDNLAKVCDEIFGASNFVAKIVVQNNPRGRQSDTFVATVHEYLLCYAKCISLCKINGAPLTEEQKGEYSLSDEKGAYRLLGLRQRGVASLREDRPDMFFPIYVNPQTLEVSLTEHKDWSIVIPKKSDGREGRWMWGKTKCIADHDRLVARLIERRGEFDVFVKDYLDRSDSTRTRKYRSIWDDKAINNQNGTQEVKRILDGDYMSFPKSMQYIKMVCQMLSEKDCIICDFFSGSATTAHAAMQLNAEDGGHRKFIMVQLPEKTDESSEAYKAGYPNICEIGKERIRRAGRKIKDEAGLTAQNLDIGFRVLRLDSSNMQDVYYNPAAMTQDLLSTTTDNIKPDRSPEDLLFQVMLDLGVELSSPITETVIGGKKVYDVADGFLLACFDTGVTTETVTAIAKKQPYYAVFRDSSMADDSTATNFDQIFETYSPNTVRKVL